ncbi:TetR/AcrR family transcriptional regulator C-terminal domain-containing protein [Saccharopolyspora erythraea]|uniref:TetR/AcrR family transcriptional regulator n=1 Tax=Saccharopolyspora erythraea TaxID=1836 RepID=UPI001BA95C2A|nr:TetR/AcrR family transcriptional regulator C-terminal domain-containing protein [Saccharopolyspora erythraea]QUH02399.1 TetR/AcrR family transcriptional regulator C-terminal domain-containing protein [Saccharopolyspora erythraea]
MPRETLTRDQIVRAAIELLDAEGVEGLSMRRLGQRLGSAATAVYWHVGNKDNLLGLAGDQVWAEVDLPAPEESGWRAAAGALAHGTYAMLARHPWLVPAIGAHFLYGPGLARYQDHCYAVLEEAGFAGTDLDWAMNALFTFVLGTALNDSTEAAMKAQIRREGGDEQERLEEFSSWANGIAAQYPRLQARIAELGEGDQEELKAESFEFGVQTILNGLEARLAATADAPAQTR